MSHQQSQELLDQDLTRLQRLLNHALQNTDLNQNHPGLLRILNLACGNCHEAETLANHFASPTLPSPPQPSPQVELVGVDIRQREIAHARARCRQYLRKLSQTKGAQPAAHLSFEFLAADATKVDSHQELSDPFDVVFLRHQNFWHDKEIWHEIFQQGLDKLAPGGTLILTSYFDREHALALQAVQHLGGNLITSIENGASRALLTPGKSVDKHLAVFQKPL